MDKAYIFLTDGFEEIEALATVDILRRADIDVLMVSVQESKTVVGSHDIQVIADGLFADYSYNDAEILILPGGPGAAMFDEHIPLKELLKEKAQSCMLAAICAAPFIFGKLDLLKGKEAVCYPGYEAYLNGADVSNTACVADGNIITGRAAGATFSFALKIVEKLRGIETAKLLVKKMIIN